MTKVLTGGVSRVLWQMDSWGSFDAHVRGPHPL
jgi:hypothetical protein